ncbi:PIG-X [Lenzites betulinus]|nr:PIG-X [Lenzites betulinus]
MATLASSVAVQGFHFTLSTVVSVPDTSLLENRALHVVYDLDPHVYADQYELAQRPGYTSVLWGTSDLEKPVAVVDLGGSVLLLTADTSHLSRGQPANITLEVPLHARYGKPVASTNASNAFYHIPLKNPLGFFAEDGHCASNTLRQYTTLLGWPTASSSLIPDTSPDSTFDIVIPVGMLEDLAWVDIGTATVMIVMFLYLLHVSIRTAQRLSGKSSTKTD